MRYFLSVLLSLFAAYSFAVEMSEGEGTFYGGVAGSDGGNCRIFVEEGNYRHCAMNHTDYDSSSTCGACVHVFGPKGEIELKIVDRCPECKKGDIDMTPEAFESIANKEDGRVKIKWYYIACPDAKTIKFQFVPSMNQWYFDLAVMDHRYDVSSLEYLNKNSEWVAVRRTMDNHWQIITGEIPQAPYTFRLKSSMTDEVMVFENVPLVAGGEYDTKKQFALVEVNETSIHTYINDVDNFAAPYTIYNIDGSVIGTYDYIPNIENRVVIVKSQKSGRAIKLVSRRSY